MTIKDVDSSKLGNMQYGQEIAEKLKSQYIGVKIKDFGYDYIAEDFYIKLDNKNEEVIWLGLT